MGRVSRAARSLTVSQRADVASALLGLVLVLLAPRVAMLAPVGRADGARTVRGIAKIEGKRLTLRPAKTPAREGEMPVVALAAKG